MILNERYVLFLEQQTTLEFPLPFYDDFLLFEGGEKLFWVGSGRDPRARQVNASIVAHISRVKAFPSFEIVISTLTGGVFR